MPMNVQLPDGRMIEFPDGTDPAVIKSTAKRFIDNPLAGVSTEELKATPSASSSIGDIGRALGTGLVGTAKSISDVFGAGSTASNYLGETLQGIQSGLSPERQEEMARRSELIDRANKSGSTFEQAKAYLGGVTEAPLQTTIQALGSSAPSIIAGLATLPVSAPAGIAAGVALISRLALGAAQGVGEFKGSAYDEVKAHYMKEGKSPEESSRLAEEAQQYSMDKALQYGGSALLGSLDAVLGSENVAMKAMRKAAPTGKMTKEAIEAGIGALPEKALTKPSFGRAIGESMLGEAPLEGAQGAFGQYAQNVAMQQAGIETPTGEGVVGSGLRDMLVGALAGGAFSPLHKSTMNAAYQTDQFLRQAKGEQELTTMKEESLKKAEVEDARKMKMRSMVEGEPSDLLALPAPAVKAEKEIAPAIMDLQDPVGKVGRNELPAQTISYIDKYRADNNLPRLASFSLEDIKDAMTSQNPEGERAALDSIIAAKTGYTGKEKYTPEDVVNAAVEKNIAYETKGFSDFLQRATGERDVNAMSQPQLFSAFNALKATKPSATGEQVVLPEGSNATRFTTDQYNEGLTLLGKYLEQAGDKPLSMDQATEVVSAQTDLGPYAKDILRVASTNDDVIVENGPVFNAVNKETGEIIGSYGVKEDAEKAAGKAGTVQESRGPVVRSRIPEKQLERAVLPGGRAIEEEIFKEGEKPAEYQIMVEGKAKPLATVIEETEVAGKIERLQGLRQKEAAKILADIEKHEKTVNKGRSSLESMEARGLVDTEGFKKAQAQQARAEDILGRRIKRMLDQIEELSAPLTSKPAGKRQVTRTAFKLTKEGKDLGRFPSRAAAEESALSELSDAELETLTTQEGPTADRAAKVLEARKEQKEGKTGIKVKGTAAGLGAAGVYTDETKAKIDALEKILQPMLAKFGLGDVGLKIVRELKSGAEGSYLDKLIEVTLKADKPIITMRHEALHALKDMGFFTAAQWNVLEKKAKDEWVDKHLKGVMAEIDGKVMSRYEAYKSLGLTDEAILEEAIADAFASYEEGTETPPAGMIAALFKRLQQFFAAFAQALGRAKIESAEEIFGKIEKGELARSSMEQAVNEKLSLKEVKQVAGQLDLEEGLLSNTSLEFQTGKTGERQFKTPLVGSLPEVIEFLENRRKATGTRLLETSKSEDRETIADLMAAEAMASINAGGSALTWYDETVARTIGMAALKYPELNNDLNAQMAFKISTAIASQGLNVEDNLTFADKQYAGFSETKKKTGVGQFKEIGSGADAKAMVSNFKMANEMIREYGEDTLRNFLQTEFTVEQLRAAGFKITGELGTETVTGSAIFGPKIGFGFYSNLSGNFEPVTMDMWFMRLIGRLTGKLKEFDSDLFQQQLQRFRTAFNETGEDGVYANDFKPEILDKARTDEASAIELARVVNSVFNSDFINNRGLFDGEGRKKTELVYAAQTMIGSLDASKDAPKNGTERKELRDIVARTVAKVEKAYGQRIPPAALQALVWYPEQELYKSLGVKLRVTSQDYAGAMAKILKKDGYDERSIRAAAKSGSRQLQRMAKQPVGQANQQTGQKPRLTFTEQEQAEFLDTARTKSVVKEERVTPKLHKVVFEVAPDPNNIELTNAWRALDQKTRNEISERVSKKIIKQAMAELGADGVLTSQVGSYIDDTNPSFAFFLKKGNPVEVAKFLGFVLSQDSMVVLSPRPGPGMEKIGAIVVDVKTQDAKKIDEIYQLLRSIRVNGEQPVGGQSTMNDQMILLNYSDVTTENLAQLIDQKLGGAYDTKTADVYSAYPEKKDYDYGSPQNDPRGKAGDLRERARSLQSQATEELSKELGKVAPKTVGTEAKLSLRTHFPSAEEAENAANKKAPPQTREFKLFFGASTLMDEGRPQVMYHASPEDFNTFRENKPIFISPDASSAESFAERKISEGQKGKVRIYPLWVRSETPFDFENPEHVQSVVQQMVDKHTSPEMANRIQLGGGLSYTTPDELTKRLQNGQWDWIESSRIQGAIKSLGFDSFYVQEGNQKNLAVYSAEQVKSVTGNIGEFGREAKDIRFSLPTVSKQLDDRVNATTTTREQVGFAERITDAISPKARSYFRAKALNRYNQLGVYDKKLAEKMGGAAFLADRSAESAALMSDLGAGVTASALGFGDRHGGIPVYKNGVTTIDRSVKGLVAALAPLAKYGDPKIYQYYQYWAAVKRGTRLLEAGKERLIDKGDIALAAELEKKFPEFVQVQKDYTVFNNGIVTYMVDTGVLSKERGAEYMKYADYVPFYRQADGETTIGPNIFQAIAGVKPPKKLKGSEAPLADFLETIVRNTQASIQAGMKNSAAQRAVNVAVQVTEPNMGAERLNTKQSGPDIINVLEKGEQVSYRTHDPLLVDAISSLHMPDLPFIGILSAPANLLRNLVTKDPGFMMANLMRDSLSAWVTSGQKMTPIAGTIINFGKALAGKSPGMEALMDAGVIGGYEFSANVESSGAKLSQDLSRKSGKEGLAAPLKAVRWLWEGLEKGTTASDAATRALVYERVLKETGNEAEALFRAMEVMNFNRKGSSPIIRVLTAAIPFFNARLQGLDVFYRASTGQMNMSDAKGIQKAFFVRGAMMAGLTALYWFLTHDDKEYKKQEQETRDNNWLLPSLGMKIPIPFEVGTLFKTVPERILEYTFGNDTGKDFAKSMGRSVLSTFAFNPVPQAVKPIVEVVSNFDFFTMRPILGQGMQDIASKYQVGPSTSKAFEAFGNLTGMSPIMAEHLYKGYTGTMGMYLVDVVDSILNANSNSPNATKRFEQLPVVKRFALDPDARGNITQYYELKHSVDTTVRTMNMLEKTAKPAQFAEFVQANKGYVATKDYVRDMEKQMKEFREMRLAVRTSGMSGDKKQEVNRNITRAENQLTDNMQSLKKIIASMK